MMPLRVDLSRRGTNETAPAGGLRYIDVTKIHRFELLPGRGMQLAARVELHWPERRLLRTIRIERVGLLLLPRIETATGGQTALASDVRFTDIDIRWIPSFIEALIVRWLNRRLRSQATALRLDLSSLMQIDFPQVADRTNLESVGVEAHEAHLTIAGDALHIGSPEIHATVNRDPREPLEPEGNPDNPALHGDEERLMPPGELESPALHETPRVREFLSGGPPPPLHPPLADPPPRAPQGDPPSEPHRH